MYAQGVTDLQIGLLLSVSMAVQVFFSFAGGIITDKLGRKATLLLGDFFGWSVTCLVWAVSHNFWLFFAAAIMNSFENINQTAWQCLLVEDAEEKDLVNIYTWVHIAGLASVFFAPLSGMFISRFTLIPVIRGLYVCFSISMVAKGIITYRYTRETKQGIIRKQESKDVSPLRMVAEYKNLIPQIFKNKAAMRMMALTVILFITGMVSGNFFSLYVSKNLGVPEQYLAVFPILRAVVMLVFMFGIQHRLEHIKSKAPMWAGLGIYAACQIMLAAAPPGNILPVVLFILFEAIANALVMPRKDAMLMASIDPKERARIVALMTSFMIAFSSPFGYMAGVLSGVNRRLPFVFNCVLYLLAIVVAGNFYKHTPAEQTTAEAAH
jgi:MFS family permease